MIRDFWMPNRDLQGCDVNDPSARVLPNYGASGVSGKPGDGWPKMNENTSFAYANEATAAIYGPALPHSKRGG